MQSPWQRVVEYANRHGCDWARNPGDDETNWGIHLQDPPPHNRLLGPVFARGTTSGCIDVAGETVCRFGDPARADMTFSVTKTYLALVAGIAFDQGLIADLDEPVSVRVPGIGFDEDQNREVTWQQLLQFTSDGVGLASAFPIKSTTIGTSGFNRSRRKACRPKEPGDPCSHPESTGNTTMFGSTSSHSR